MRLTGKFLLTSILVMTLAGTLTLARQHGGGSPGGGPASGPAHTPTPTTPPGGGAAGGPTAGAGGLGGSAVETPVDAATAQAVNRAREEFRRRRERCSHINFGISITILDESETITECRYRSTGEFAEAETNRINEGLADPTFGAETESIPNAPGIRLTDAAVAAALDIPIVPRPDLQCELVTYTRYTGPKISVELFVSDLCLPHLLDEGEFEGMFLGGIKIEW